MIDEITQHNAKSTHSRNRKIKIQRVTSIFSTQFKLFMHKLLIVFCCRILTLIKAELFEYE